MLMIETDGARIKVEGRTAIVDGRTLLTALGQATDYVRCRLYHSRVNSQGNYYQ